MQKQQIEGFRLSPQQKHLWLLQQSANASPYRVRYAVLITDNLKIDVLKIALQNVVNQYEILRTTFSFLPGMEIPLQVIIDNYDISLTELNFTDLSWQEQETKIESLLNELNKIPFNLENHPPLQTYIVTLSPKKYILILNLSALIADSSTLKYLIDKISISYSACLQSQDFIDEPMQYADIAEWQNELLDSESDLGKEYWRKQDITSIDNFNFWFENQQIETSEFQPQCISLTINTDLVKQIESLTHIYNVNKSNFLLTCWLILLWKITKQSDMFIGVASDGRKYEELDQALGLLTKYLPLCFHLKAEFKFSEILKQVTESANNAYEWQEYFTWEETAKSETFCPFTFEFSECIEHSSVADLSFSLYKQYSCIDKFKIKLSGFDTSDSLITEFYFDANLYNAQDIKTLSEQFKTLLEDAISNPEATISQLNILSDRQLQKLLIEFNNTNANYPQDKCIHQIFEEQVRRTPDEIVLVFEQQQLTYAQLNIRANQLAHHLRQRGVGPEVLVGLYVERSLEMVIGLLGILKAGGAYIPLDPAYPQQRLAGMLEDAQVKVLLTQKSLISNLTQYPAEVICLDADWEKIAQQSPENPHTDVKPENLVYVIFTSGSTGKPKGVAVEHRQLCNYLYAILEKLDFSTCTSFAHVATFAADLGNTIIFPALCIGGCLHIVSQERVSHPEALAEYFHHHTIDCLKIVPTHLAALLTSSQPEKILPRKRLILGGEACSWQLIEQIQQLAPDCQIFNHYGPTETTVGVLTYPIKPGQRQNDSTTVPIGRAIANTQIYLLDSHQKPVPLGMSGELYIGGHNLARGYLHQPELTQAKFIPHPFVPDARLYKTGDLARYLPDGNIEFLGRIDHQVKIRGFRIELEEISRILEQHPQVQQTVIVVREDVPGDKRLVAYIICDAKSQINPTSTDLRSFLQEKLPEYMIPSAFVTLKTLPLTANGKLDREKLPAPELVENFVAPRTNHEELIAGIWEEILNLKKVGIHNNFFELGGHSLLATQVISRLQQTFGVTMTLRHLFEFPTVSELAVIITQQLAEQADEEMLSQMLAELEELSEEEVQATLAKEGASK
ncbi:MAG: amino acid adenylation domain-containing protein [Nodularia sp. CChRGM 3473]